jgi:hypothetical protein
MKLYSVIVPLIVANAILSDISLICKDYPYRNGSVWTNAQDRAWLKQPESDMSEYPSVSDVNVFCEDKGYHA